MLSKDPSALYHPRPVASLTAPSVTPQLINSLYLASQRPGVQGEFSEASFMAQLYVERGIIQGVMGGKYAAE